jgi:hypothetical protein
MDNLFFSAFSPLREFIEIFFPKFEMINKKR